MNTDKREMKDLTEKENWYDFDETFDCGNLEDGRRVCSFSESKVKNYILAHFISKEKVETNKVMKKK